jgi:hypothetical protein
MEETVTRERRIVVKGGFEKFQVGDAVTAPFLKSPFARTGAEVNTSDVPGVVVAKHEAYVVVCHPSVALLGPVFEPDHLTVIGKGDVAAALAEYAARVS